MHTSAVASGWNLKSGVVYCSVPRRCWLVRVQQDAGSPYPMARPVATILSLHVPCKHANIAGKRELRTDACMLHAPRRKVGHEIFIMFVCFLYDRIQNPACKDPCTSQGLQGHRKYSRQTRNRMHCNHSNPMHQAPTVNTDSFRTKKGTVDTVQYQCFT